MKKIKILQMPVRNAKGGITQYALRNWEYIDKRRFLFDWVTLDKELSFEPELTRQGCKVYHLSCRQEDDEARFRSEMEAMFANGYDAIHLHTSYWRGFLNIPLQIWQHRSSNAVLTNCAQCGNVSFVRTVFTEGE